MGEGSKSCPKVVMFTLETTLKGGHSKAAFQHSPCWNPWTWSAWILDHLADTQLGNNGVAPLVPTTHPEAMYPCFLVSRW